MSSGAILAGKAFVELYAEKQRLYQDLTQSEERFRLWVRNVGLASAAVGAGILGSLLPAVRAASNQAETLNAFIEVFRGANAEADRLAKTLADDVGRSLSSIRTGMTPIGAMVKGLGLASDEAARFAEQATRAALDISSFYNSDTDETFQRLRSALSGSSEAVDQFGINLRSQALEMKLAELGYEGNVQAASELEKTLARLALIQDALTRQNAMGDAARTAGQFANASRSLSDAVTALKENIGKALLPAAERITVALTSATKAMADFAGRHPIVVQALAVLAVGAIAAGTALVGLVVAAKIAILFSQLSFAILLARAALAAFTGTAGATTGVLAALNISLAVTGGLFKGLMGSMAGAAGPLQALRQGAVYLQTAFVSLGPAIGSALLSLVSRLPMLRLAVPIVRGIAMAFGLLTGPIGWTIAALAAVGAGVVLLQRNFGTFTPFLEQFKSVGGAVAGLKAAFAALGQVWSSLIAPALHELGSSLGAAFTTFGKFIGAIDRSLQISAGFKQVLKDLGTLFSDVLVGGVKAFTSSVQVMTGALMAAYDVAAALGLVTSRQERERGENYDQQIARNQKRLREREQPPAANQPGKPPLSEEQLQELDSFAQGVIDATKTPLETYREQMQKLALAFEQGKLTAEQLRRGQEDALNALEGDLRTPEQEFAANLKLLNDAFRAGLLTPEEANRKKAQLEKDRDERIKQEFEQSPEGIQARGLKDFAEQLQKSTQTPLEAFQEQMRKIEQAFNAGALTADLAKRGVEAARASLKEAQDRIAEEAKKAAEEARKNQLDKINRIADMRISVAKAVGGDEGKKQEIEALRQQVEDLRKGGFQAEHFDRLVDYLGAIVDRSAELDKEVQQQRDAATLQTYSKGEAVYGLGYQTIDQQLLEEQKAARIAAQEAKGTLDRIHTALTNP